MLIHVEIAFALELQIECAVSREEFQHVIEKPNARRDLVCALSLNCEPEHDASFGGLAVDQRRAGRGLRFPGLRIETWGTRRSVLWHHSLTSRAERSANASFIAAIARCICCRVPMV